MPRVTGVDASAEQVAAARARGLDAHVADGTRVALRRGIRRGVQQRGAALDARSRCGDRRRLARVEAGRAIRRGMRRRRQCRDRARRAGRALARRGIDGRGGEPVVFPGRRRNIAPGSSGAASPSTSIDLIPRPTPLPGRSPTGSTPSPRASSPRCPRPSAAPSRTRSRRCCGATLCDASGAWTVDYVRLDSPR